MSFKFGTSDVIYNTNLKNVGQAAVINLSHQPAQAPNETAVQGVMKSVGKTASKVIENGGDVLSAPAVWLKDMQQNWLTYMIVVAVILSTITFLYCAGRFYLNGKKNNLSSNNLVELVKVISEKNGALQHPLALSAIDLPSVPPNLSTRF